MPPLVLHTAIAKNVADGLRLSLLDDERGSLYMGATAPDIRVVTRWERERTHFFDLNNFSEQDGVAAFFEAYPSLVGGTLEPPTRAFVAGYLTHLVMDERWISSVYRPFFGERSPLGGDLRANIMDRALQFSMDCDRRKDAEFMSHVVGAVARCDLAFDVGFIDADSLRQWQRIVTDMMNRTPDWDRFRHGARRHLGYAEGAGEEFEEMVRSIPDLVDETLKYLTVERVDEFLDDAEGRSLATVKEYLQCA
jgi:hypothetical protein